MLAVVVLLTAWVAGRESPAPAGDGGTDAVRLGPRPGETVAGYLARARPLGDPRSVRVALVELDGPLGPDAAASTVARDAARDAAGVAAGVVPTAVVFRVPLPRVQTALRRIDLPALPSGADGAPASGTGPPPGPDAADVATALRDAQSRAAAEAATATRDAPPGRSADVARAEAAALRAGCACVLALVVRADPAPGAGDPLAVVATRPGVRAVEVAPAASGPDPRLALSPLLPEQGDGRPDGPVVGPVPDDGPVPPA